MPKTTEETHRRYLIGLGLWTAIQHLEGVENEELGEEQRHPGPIRCPTCGEPKTQSDYTRQDIKEMREILRTSSEFWEFIPTYVRHYGAVNDLYEMPCT